MEPNTNTEVDYLDLSDDEIMNMSAPPAGAAPVVETPDPDESETITPPGTPEGGTGSEEEISEGGSTPPAPAGEANADEPVIDDALNAPDDGVPADKTTTPPQKDEPPVAPKDGEPVVPDPKETPSKDEPKDPPAPKEDAEKDKPKEPTADDHKAFYDRLLGKPIKANGKEIRLQSPDEAEKLIQMGLNYTKKMQAMQPALRVVKMLENNGLMDESKLSHLIDISKGDSGAIQKLLADTKFDPMSADAEQAAKYVPADHRVSDIEMTFSAVLEDVQQTPAGVELISEVHGQWDADSKRALFEKPQLLATLAEQKTLGLYAQISGEVDRLRALGQITPDIPFLQAYHAVGDMLHQQGRLTRKEEIPPAPAVVVPPAVPVETRVAAPAAKVKNTAQAQATAPVRTAPSNPKPPTLDYLSMDDAEFAKQTAGRF